MPSEQCKSCAAGDALDAIAKLTGAPAWEYPGQVVRDVEAALKPTPAVPSKEACREAAESLDSDAFVHEESASNTNSAEFSDYEEAIARALRLVAAHLRSLHAEARIEPARPCKTCGRYDCGILARGEDLPCWKPPERTCGTCRRERGWDPMCGECNGDDALPGWTLREGQEKGGTDGK